MSGGLKHNKMGDTEFFFWEMEKWSQIKEYVLEDFAVAIITCYAGEGSLY